MFNFKIGIKSISTTWVELEADSVVEALGAVSGDEDQSTMPQEIWEVVRDGVPVDQIEVEDAAHTLTPFDIAEDGGAADTVAKVADDSDTKEAWRKLVERCAELQKGKTVYYGDNFSAGLVWGEEGVEVDGLVIEGDDDRISPVELRNAMRELNSCVSDYSHEITALHDSVVAFIVLHCVDSSTDQDLVDQTLENLRSDAEGYQLGL
jgi:hypothetical protein